MIGPAFEWLGLNCLQAHSVLIEERGGRLEYGYAVGPGGIRYQHTWAVVDNEPVDLFGWKDHESAGGRPPIETSGIRDHLVSMGVDIESAIIRSHQVV